MSVQVGDSSIDNESGPLLDASSKAAPVVRKRNTLSLVR